MDFKPFLIPVFALFIAAGCNGHLFIDERLEVSCPEFTVPYDGDTVEVKVSKEDWFVKYVCVDKQFYDGIVYEEGQMPVEGYMSLDGLGHIEWADSHCAFSVCRNAPDSLVLIFDGNSSGIERTVVVGIANEFENSVMLIHLSDIGSYSFETEWYHYGNPETEKRKVRTLTFENDTDAPVAVSVNVFEDAKRIISYENIYLKTNPEYLYERNDGPLMMDIPDPFLKKAGSPGSIDDREIFSFSGLRDTLRFDRSSFIPVELPSTYAELTVEPGVQKFDLYWTYYKYRTSFNLMVSTPSSERVDKFSILFTSWMPDGQWAIVEADKIIL